MLQKARFVNFIVMDSLGLSKKRKVKQAKFIRNLVNRAKGKADINKKYKFVSIE